MELPPTDGNGTPPGRAYRQQTRGSGSEHAPSGRDEVTREPTGDEAVAIRAAARLAKRWPDTLMMFGGPGWLAIAPTDWDRDQPFEPQVFAYLQGIPSDGGDPD